LDKRSFLKKAVVGAAGGAAILGAPAVIGQAPAVRWRLTSGFPKSLDTLYGISEVFAKQVSAMTGGKFQISTHGPGELVPTPGIVEAIEKGTVEMAHTASYYYFGKDDTFALDCAIPFGLNARQMNAWLYEGNGVKLMREFFAGYNIYNIPGGNTGAQMGGWYRKEIKSVADFKGLKFRVGGFAGRSSSDGRRAAEHPGRRHLSGAGKRARSTRPNGSVRTTTRSSASTRSRRSTRIRAGGNRSRPVVLREHEGVGSAAADYKAIVESAAAHAGVDMVAKYDARNPAALKRLVAQGGAKLFPFPKDVMDSALKNALELYSDLSAKNPKWKKIYEDYAKFRGDQNLWFQFTEATMDKYMQSQKW
jgi:TRAP-type mannitol/chloroaromatic compound transport system substrate-binding protein